MRVGTSRSPSADTAAQDRARPRSRPVASVRRTGGLVDALILGRRGGIDPQLQERFAGRGLGSSPLDLRIPRRTHLRPGCSFSAACSGSGRSCALTLAAAVSVAYVAFLGWPAPATRAAALAVVSRDAALRQRHVHTDSAAGGHLSHRAPDRSLGHSRPGRLAVGRRTVGRDQVQPLERSGARPGLRGGEHWAASVGATLATAPITAVALGTVRPCGLALNFAAIPLAAVAVPGVLASLCSYPGGLASRGRLPPGPGSRFTCSSWPRPPAPRFRADT